MSVIVQPGLSPPVVVRPAGLAHLADRVVCLTVEIGAAAIVLAEICVLFAGVLGRFVLDAPLIWSDEFASILARRARCSARGPLRPAHAAHHSG